jgi:hypothetical protein
MKRLCGLIALLAGLAVIGTAPAALVHLVVTPGAVAPGALIRVGTTSSPCLPGDQITLISSVFRGHAFGEGAVYGRVGSHGAFTVKSRIRSALPAGRYEIGGRCGGGNLGVSVSLRVR